MILWFLKRDAHMESYFHMDHAKKTCPTTSPNLLTESQKYGKSQYVEDCFSGKNSLRKMERVLHFSVQIGRKVFVILSWQILDKKSAKTLNDVLRRKIKYFKMWIFFLRNCVIVWFSYQIRICCNASLPCFTHMKVKFTKITKLFVSLCLFIYFLLQDLDPKQFFLKYYFKLCLLSFLKNN